MTRINVGIPPKELSNKHLIAEHREIKRIPNHFKKFGEKCLVDIPKEFCLGKGHVKFFLDKPWYTYTRYLEIYKECLNRGFKVTCYANAWESYIGFENLVNYFPTPKDIELIKERIREKTRL